MTTGTLALALVAGAVAAFNPCGFALLPAYLMMVVATPPDTKRQDGLVAGLARAGRFSLGMTLGFVAVFGIFGALVAPLALSIERYLPMVTIVVGVLLVVAGGWLLSGRPLGLPGLPTPGAGPTRAWSSQVGYGITFALVSLSCTVAPFLAVTSGALSSGRATGVVGSFVAYALGMGVVVLVLAVAVAVAGTGVTAVVRRAVPAISRLSGVLLLVAGGYVAWYGWFELRVLAGTTTEDPVVTAAVSVQGWLTRIIIDLGAATVLGAALTLVVAGAGLALWRRARDRESLGSAVGRRTP